MIDLGELHRNEDRVWRLFREIVEGLEHIHSKVSRGMERREERGGEKKGIILLILPIHTHRV